MNIWYNVSDNVRYKSKLLIILHNHLEEKEVSNFLECNGLEKKWKPEISQYFLSLFRTTYFFDVQTNKDI